MNPDIKKYLLALSWKKIQEHKNVAVFLILCNLDHSPKYLSLWLDTDPDLPEVAALYRRVASFE